MTFQLNVMQPLSTHTAPYKWCYCLNCVGMRSKLLPGVFLGSAPYCVLVHLGDLELIDNVINHMRESENKQRPYYIQDSLTRRAGITGGITTFLRDCGEAGSSLCMSQVRTVLATWEQAFLEWHQVAMRDRGRGRGHKGKKRGREEGKVREGGARCREKKKGGRKNDAPAIPETNFIFWFLALDK